jgi:hypothetical protein
MDKKYLSSNDNKGYLWKMLHENGVFINIDNKFVQDIKNKFEIIVSNIEHSISNGTVEPNLLICNKQIIEQMLNVLKTYKNAPNNAPNNVPNNSPHNTSHNTQYSRLNNDNNTFEKQLKEKEADFQQLISKPVPPKVNFEDVNTDKPINIENNLDELKKTRNYIDEKYDVRKNIDELNEKMKKQDDIIKILLHKINILEKKTIISDISNLENPNDNNSSI